MEVQNLKAYLANIGMTVKDFCEIIDVDKRYMSQIIRGKMKAGPRLAKDVREATSGIVHLETRVRKKDQKHDESQNDQEQARAI